MAARFVKHLRRVWVEELCRARLDLGRVGIANRHRRPARVRGRVHREQPPIAR